MTITEDPMEAAILSGELEIPDDINDIVWQDDESGVPSGMANPFRHLTVLPTTARFMLGTWTPEAYTRSRWQVLGHTDFNGVWHPAPVAVRAVELLGAYFWAIRWDGVVYALPRLTKARSAYSGGVLRPMDPLWLSHVSAQFRAIADTKSVLSGSARRDAVEAWKGHAAELHEVPYTRWGRAGDGALWWDSGRDDDDAFVRVDATGWSSESEPDCWFRRPDTLVALPPPLRGDDITRLWDHLNIPESDRSLVLSWLLASMLPGATEAAGMLYLWGPAGSGKSTAMGVLTGAAGGEPNRQAPSGSGTSERDLFAVASDGWVMGADNVSSWSAVESDHLCRIISGTSAKLRTYYTTAGTTHIRVRRPVIATSIEVPVLREDLVRRMVPARLSKLDSPASDHDMATRWRQGQPGVFGALLDLLVKVLAVGPPPKGVDLTTLPSWGQMAWALDQVIAPPDGESTITRCLERRRELASDEVHDDPFWLAARRALRGREFIGTAAMFIERVEEMAWSSNKRLPKTWPTPAAFRGRVARREEGLLAAGWSISQVERRDSTGRHPVRWRIVGPEAIDSDDKHADTCTCIECSGHTWF